MQGSGECQSEKNDYYAEFTLSFLRLEREKKEKKEFFFLSRRKTSLSLRAIMRRSRKAEK
jgi:hypothetical protein